MAGVEGNLMELHFATEMHKINVMIYSHFLIVVDQDQRLRQSGIWLKRKKG